MIGHVSLTLRSEPLFKGTEELPVVYGGFSPQNSSSIAIFHDSYLD